MDPNEQPSWAGGDAPDKQKMDEIRARRLAKLGGPPAAAASSSPSKTDENKAPGSDSSKPSPPSTSKPPATEAETTRTKINITPAPSSSPANPNASTSAAPKQGSPAQATAPSGSTRPSRKRSASVNEDGVAAPARRADPPKAESDEDYADRILSQIFRITVNPHQRSNLQGVRFTFLPNLNQELNDAGEPLKLSINVLDQAIIEACSEWPVNQPLMNYLLPCWKRAVKAAPVKAATSASFTTGAKFEVHQEAKRLCMSNCLFALTMPALYGREPNPDHDTIVPFLLRSVTHDDGICFDFIREAIKRFDDDEAFPAIFDDAMVKISTKLASISMEDDYKPYVQVRDEIQLLVSFFLLFRPDTDIST
jgi:ubiquitin conjugation factor E4 B